ncbi:MAG: hypothetical protein IH884_06935, partial [Myxococcales bacterium]|nr:hypothetical protein [Myxococcales bacterium]
DHTSGKRSILVIDSAFNPGTLAGLAVIRVFIDDDISDNQKRLYQGEPFGVPRRGAIGLGCDGDDEGDDADPVIFVTDSKGYNVSGVDSVVWQLRWSGTEWEVRGGPEPDLFLDQPLTSGGNLDRPIGIAQLPPQPPPPDEPLQAGKLLVADAASQALIEIDVCTGVQTIISAGNLFDKPWEVVIGGAFPGFKKADLLYANTGSSQSVTGVRELLLDSATEATFSEGSPFERPAIIAPDLAGNWIVSDDDPATPKVVWVSGDGATRTAIASGPPLVCPKGVVVDAAGDVIVADPCAGQLFRIPFDADAGEPNSYGMIEPFPDNPLPEREFLRRPTTVGILADGFLLVGDAGEDPPPDPENPDPGRLVLISPKFNTQLCLAEETQLRDLRAWTQDVDGSFLITTPNDAKLIRFIPDLTTFLVEATDLVSPEGVAIDLNRDILVIDSMDPGMMGDAQLLRVDPVSTSLPVLENMAFSMLFDPFGLLVRSDLPSEPPDAATQQDSDEDKIDDRFDNCIGRSNPAEDDGDGNIVQLDTNGNGLGDVCDEPSADADGDGIVGVADFILLSGQFGSSTGGSADFTGDSFVGTSDFILLSGDFGLILKAGDLSGPLGCPPSQLD